MVGCPTYAGRVPNLLMPYLRDMVRGSGALAVPVALFGNRNYDDALMELSQLLTAGGFTCVGGGAFVGEHSFSSHWVRVVQTRTDQAEMDAFADGLAAKLRVGEYRCRHRRRLRPHRALLYAPRPPRKPHQHPEGQAENGHDAMRRLWLVRRTLPHGQHRSNGRVAGKRRMHQVLCLRQGLSHRGEVF